MGEDESFGTFKVGVKVKIPGSLLTVEAPEKITMVVQEFGKIGSGYHLLLNATEGISKLDIQGNKAEFEKLVGLISGLINQ